MKKLLLVVAFIFTAHAGFAQDEAFKTDVKKLIEVSGGNASIEVAKKQVMAMIPADKQEAFMKEFEESLKPVMDAQIDFYLKEYTHDDVKKLIDFYNTPLGKKMAENAPKMAEANMKVLQEWSMNLQGIMMKYMQ